MQQLISKERFDKLLLITTTSLDAGFNICDSELHNMVIDGVDDPDTIEQCIGRKRFQSEGDTLAVYISELQPHTLNAKINNLNKGICMANYADEFGTTAMITKYNRQPDLSRITYDCISSDGRPDKGINRVLLCASRYRLAEFKAIRELKEHGFAQYVADRLGTNYEIYNSTGKQNDVETLLALYEGKPLLTKKDREPFIEALNVRQNRKQVRSAESLTAIFEEFKLNYRIRKFLTSRNIKDSEGKTIKKNYTAWIVERC